MSRDQFFGCALFALEMGKRRAYRDDLRRRKRPTSIKPTFDGADKLLAAFGFDAQAPVFMHRFTLRGVLPCSAEAVVERYQLESTVNRMALDAGPDGVFTTIDMLASDRAALERDVERLRVALGD